MRTIPALLLGSLIMASAVLASGRTASRTSEYSDAVYGFSLNAPQFPKPQSGKNVIAVVMQAPVEDGFAANVNVMVQAASMSRKAYRDLSVRQFRQLGFKVNSERTMTVSGREAVLFDYEGLMNGREMRFLALAVPDKNRVFVVTGTAPKERFQAYEPAFHASIQSFRLAQQ
jgi:hypothetical protein